jgi:sulfite reductase beta subunit-like hemoprotein
MPRRPQPQLTPESAKIQLTLEEAIQIYKLQPAFGDLWRLSMACSDLHKCYIALARARLAGVDLEPVEEAVRAGIDAETAVSLMEKPEELRRLIQQAAQ